MVFDVGVAMTWLLFVALFPIALYWLRRAWRILMRRDFSEVALKHGEPPSDQAKFAPWAAAINLIAAGVLILVIIGVAAGALAYETWSAVAGSTIWLKIIFDFMLSRHAHIMGSGNIRGSL